MIHVPTANELLGYPNDTRLLIVNADDFGMCHSVNTAIIGAFSAGIVGSTSLMTPCAGANEAIQFLANQPHRSFAVHLTLVRDFDNYRWGPISAPHLVPSLVDAAGNFRIYAERQAMLHGADINEVETEFRAQIDLVIAKGLAPSHLDWHSLADGGREDIFELTVRLARAYGLAMRVHDRNHAESLRVRGWPTVEYPVLDSYTMDPETKQQQYLELLSSLPAGLSEWAVHPSMGDGEAQLLEPENWQVRHADSLFLTSERSEVAIRESGVVLIDYRELQDAWQASTRLGA